MKNHIFSGVTEMVGQEEIPYKHRAKERAGASGRMPAQSLAAHGLLVVTYLFIFVKNIMKFPPHIFMTHEHILNNNAKGKIC